MFVPRSVRRAAKPSEERKPPSLAHTHRGIPPADETSVILPPKEPSFIRSNGHSSPSSFEQESIKAQYEQTPESADITAETVDSCIEDKKNVQFEAADGDDEPIVQFSKDQREAVDDEPVCVVCGKYGAYICDKTDADVCSIECKAKNLSNQTPSAPVIAVAQKPSRISAAQVDAETRAEYDQTSTFHEAANWTYHEDPEVTSIPEQNRERLLHELQITIKRGASGHQVHPIIEFRHCHFPSKLVENLELHGYLCPTSIQMQVLPIAFQGFDLICSAETGSGKTLSFAIPAILHSCKFYREGEKAVPRCLIICPTRELSIQIEEKVKQLSMGLPVRTALLVGGLPISHQIQRLSRGIQVIIGTPGRLVDLIDQGELDLSSISQLVLDEVDVMLKLGFGEQVKRVIEKIGSHQTMLFSATIPPSTQKLASSICHDPITVAIGDNMRPNESIQQIIVWVEENSKKKMLLQVLNQEKYYKPPVLIFVNSKIGAELLSEWISKQYNIEVGYIHGDKKQAERTATLQKFTCGAYPILVSTGILGRGLDLVSVSQVINFDMPPSTYEYIHQIGRAGRLGSEGLSITFINSESKKLFPALASLVRNTRTILPREVLQYAEALESPSDGLKRKGDHKQTSLEPRNVESWKDELYRRKISRK